MPWCGGVCRSDGGRGSGSSGPGKPRAGDDLLSQGSHANSLQLSPSHDIILWLHLTGFLAEGPQGPSGATNQTAVPDVFDHATELVLNLIAKTRTRRCGRTSIAHHY